MNGPIYIGGLDRSGKTTMRAFLASHPNLSIPAVGSNMETYFLDRYGDISKEDRFEECLSAMMRYKHVRFLDPDPTRIRAEFREGERTYARLFEIIMTQFAQREGKPRWGMQTGLIERYADHLIDSYPGVRIIHMVRDPRDRYQASISKWPNGRLRAGGAAARWRYSARLAIRHAARYPDQYLAVRFEDMVINPESTLRQVCRFVGEVFEPTMLEMPGAEKHRNLLASGTRGDSFLSESFIGGFSGQVPPGEIRFIEMHCRRPMQHFGYVNAAVDQNLADHLRFSLITWPGQFARMAVWLAVESAQQRFPKWVPRRFGRRMLLDPPAQATA